MKLSEIYSLALACNNLYISPIPEELILKGILTAPVFMELQCRGQFRVYKRSIDPISRTIFGRLDHATDVINQWVNSVDWDCFQQNSQGNGPIRHVETCPDFFFTARVHTTKSAIKILAAKTRCKYFLKIAEVTHFFCTRNRLYQRFVQPFLPLTTAVYLSIDSTYA
jgi:hypothetical protein